MKILLICDKPPWPGTSGGALAVKSMISGLSINKTDISVLSAVTGKHNYPKKRKNIKTGTKEEHYIRINTKPGVFSLLFNLLFSDKPYNISRFNKVSFRRKLIELLNNNKYDIIQIEGLNMSCHIDTIRHNSKTCIAYRAHNVESEIWTELATGIKSNIRRWYIKILAKRIHKWELKITEQSDLLIPVSEKDASFFRLSGITTPSHTCPFGIIQEPSGQKEDCNLRLSYIGSLDWKPNQEGIIWFINTVWGKVRKSDPGIELTIAGRNAPLWLKRKLNTDGINFIGEIDDSRDYIANGCIMVVPLLSGSGIRVRIIQALAYGIPVICTPKAAEGIKAEHGKEIMIADNSETFAEIIHDVLGNDKLRKRIKHNSLTLIKKNYNNTLIIRDLISFYKTNINAD